MAGKGHESFEAQGKRYDQAEDRPALIAQIFQDMGRNNPAACVFVKQAGDRITVYYKCVDM